ncbi:MAG TPA: hypothetical protein VMM78_08450 [Thermomicrobiales bacterium]|nr:hypothetical protein [Thermomicrobiales bacterium]
MQPTEPALITAADRLPEPRVRLATGYHGTVELDHASRLVCKTYHAPDGGELAQQEFDRLTHFSRAIADQPFITCPTPDHVDIAAGQLWMTFCDGDRLNNILYRSGALSDNDIDHIANQIAISFVRYVEVLNEPVYDPGLWNMLYNSSTRVLCLLDFADPAGKIGAATDVSPLDVTLGEFVGRSTFDTIRPATCMNGYYARSQRRIATIVLQAVRARMAVQPNTITTVADLAYRRHAWFGVLRRDLWFRTVGRMLYRRRSRSIVQQAMHDNELRQA